jgi:hypothetical protein
MMNDVRSGHMGQRFHIYKLVEPATQNLPCACTLIDYVCPYLITEILNRWK